MGVNSRFIQTPQGAGLQTPNVPPSGAAGAQQPSFYLAFVPTDGSGNIPAGTIDLGNGTFSLPTQRSNAGAVAPGQTLKVYTGTVSVASGATVTLETVTTGKTFYITDIYIGSNTATQFSVTINAAATAIFNGFCKGDTGPINMAGIESQPSATTGQQVQLVLGTAASTTCAYMVSGFEQ